jgi:hypothetical protein
MAPVEGYDWAELMRWAKANPGKTLPVGGWRLYAARTGYGILILETEIVIIKSLELGQVISENIAMQAASKELLQRSLSSDAWVKRIDQKIEQVAKARSTKYKTTVEEERAKLLEFAKQCPKMTGQELYARIQIRHPEYQEFGRYLDTWFQGKDALGNLKVDPTHHAHHIVMREGLGEAGKIAVKQSQAILEKYGIDPFGGQENFAWAPNSGSNAGYLRTDVYAQQVLQRLQAAEVVQRVFSGEYARLAHSARGERKGRTVVIDEGEWVLWRLRLIWTRIESTAPLLLEVSTSYAARRRRMIGNCMCPPRRSTWMSNRVPGLPATSAVGFAQGEARGQLGRGSILGLRLAGNRPK